jgi:hypothetical protein
MIASVGMIDGQTAFVNCRLPPPNWRSGNNVSSSRSRCSAGSARLKPFLDGQAIKDDPPAQPDRRRPVASFEQALNVTL